MILNENQHNSHNSLPLFQKLEKVPGLHIAKANVWVWTYITRQNSDPNDSHNINFRFRNVPQKGMGCH